MKIKRKEGFFSISAVAKMFSVHQQTIRLYERQGLISPSRSTGNTRLFSEQDINRLEEIIYLTHEMGINLAGVEMILKLKKQIKKMQKDMNKIFEQTQKQLDEESEQSKQTIQSNVRRLMEIKKETPNTLEPSIHPAPDDASNIENIDNWEIEYED